MCFATKTVAPTPSLPIPVRRPGGPVAAFFSKRNGQNTGTFGNIFTSPLGVTGGSDTLSTTLGGTIARFFGGGGGGGNGGQSPAGA